MPQYITLIRFTQQGVENIKDGPIRLDTGKEAIREMGAELKSFHLLRGPYDAVAIVEAPDEETMAKIAFLFGSRSHSRSETYRAFTEEEYRKIIASLP